MPLTSEQQAIINFARTSNESFIINAKAGSGKTSTLNELLPVLHGSVLLMAFNKSISEELKLRVGQKHGLDVAMRTDISTVHSHSLRAFKKNKMSTKTLGDKVGFMLKDHMESFVSRDDDLWRNTGKINRLVSAAKSAGFGLSSSAENFPSIRDEAAWLLLAEHYNIEEELVGDTTLDDVCELAQLMLTRSNQRTNSIDFDDMIYLPLLLNFQLPSYDNVLIDEAQDINATRRELAFRSLSTNGRLIAVGDPNQAIYGFTGADPESLYNIQRRARAKTFPLTICWRCDAKIITQAQFQVPEIKARPNAPEGEVLYIDFEKDDFLVMPRAGDAILCRINKPNVAACLGLLRRGTKAKIEGRDLGARLQFHVERSTQLYPHQTLDLTLMDLEIYKEAEIGKLVAKNKPESAMTLLEDEIDCCVLLIERAIEEAAKANRPAEYDWFTQQINLLFGDNVEGCVVLSSIHKAKGREWPRVFILGYADWMPHRMAKMAWEQEQEQNLIYVAKTRAEHSLVFVNGAQSAIDSGLHRTVQKKPTVEADFLKYGMPKQKEPQ